MKTTPSFHLLIPLSNSNNDSCKTIFSSFVLGYPAPTLINWGRPSEAGRFPRDESHTAKISGIFDFLKDSAKVKDNDLVLIVDGYDVWFQLPAEILVERYHELVKEANERLCRRYGMVQGDAAEEESPNRGPMYTQSIIFGADKICWPKPQEDPACAAVLYSTLPKATFGPQTDQDPQAFLNRPRYLNSGTIMGPVKTVRELFENAVHKVDNGKGAMGDQFVLAEILGEQEFQRETLRRDGQGTSERWLDWLSKALGTSDSPLSANVTIKNLTAVPGKRYEFSIGLDYESRLFQTMTHSANDIDFIVYNSSLSTHPTPHSRLPLFLPPELQTAKLPLSYASPGNHTAETEHSGKKTLLLPYSPNLDALPDPQETTWHTIPLATNIRAATIPALLHINGDKSLLDTWWPRMWYHPYARALLRRSIRSTQTPTAAAAAARGGLNWWDERGGRGGVWTGNGEWMPWDEVCRGVEEEVLGDGKGVSGKEEGDGRVRNSWGRVIVGEEDEGG